MKRIIVGCAVLSLAAVCLQAPLASQTKSGGKKTVTSSAAVAEAPRAKWEYSVLTKEEVAKAGKGDFRAGLNALGDEGWELVTIHARASLGPRAPGKRPATAYYFKRTKRASAKPMPGAPAVKGKKAPPAAKELVRIISLQNAKAATLAKALDKINGQNSPVRVVSDERTNSLIVVGTEEQMFEVARLIQELDRPVPEPKPKRK